MAPEYNTGEQLGFSSHSMTAMRRKNKQQKNQSKTKQNKTTLRDYDGRLMEKGQSSIY